MKKIQEYVHIQIFAIELRQSRFLLRDRDLQFRFQMFKIC